MKRYLDWIGYAFFIFFCLSAEDVWRLFNGFSGGCSEYSSFVTSIRGRPLLQPCSHGRAAREFVCLESHTLLVVKLAESFLRPVSISVLLSHRLMGHHFCLA